MAVTARPFKEPPLTAESCGAHQGRALGDESASRYWKFESTPLQRRVRCELAPAAGVQAVIIILGNHEFADKSVPSAAPTAADHRGGSESLLSPGQNSSRSR